MNVGRFLVAVVGTWIVRVALNATFYTQVVGEQFESISSAHPGMFREVVPAYIAIDLLVAVLFVYLFAKAGAAFGGGVKGGVTLGLLVALLSPVVGNLYQFYSSTFLPAGLVGTETVFQLFAHAVQGAVVGWLYK